MKSMEQQVQKLVAEQLLISESQVVPEAAFVEDLGADSLDHFELVMNLESVFGIKIPDEEAEKIVTVQDVLDLIHAARAKLAA